MTAVREDRSPGGKHRTKRPRLSEGNEEICHVPANVKCTLEPEHTELINILIESNPERIPPRDRKYKWRSECERVISASLFNNT